MEDKELDESNEASVRAVSKLEGDGFTRQDEDSDKQSEEEKMPNISHDDAEFCNEQDDASPKSLSSRDDENVEGDAYVVQNEDHGELKQEKIQDNSHDGSNNENEHDRSSDTSSSQGVENMEGDTYVVQNEDHEEYVCHDGSKYENEHAEMLSGSSSSENVENMERNVCVVQNEDHEESKEATCKHICHNGHEYENEQDDISSEQSSSSDVKNMKEDTYVVQNDDHIESNPDKSLNISPDVHKYENEEDDDKSSHASNSKDFENLGDTLDVDNEDHKESKQEKSQNKYENEEDDDKSSHTSNSQDFENRGDTLDVDNEVHEESKQEKSQNISHDGLKYENEQSDLSSHPSCSQDVENLKGDTYVVQNEDQEESDQVRSENISRDGSKYDNEQDDISSDTSSFETIEMRQSDAKEEKFENLGYDGPGFEKRVDDILDNIYGNIDEDSNTPKRVNNVIGEEKTSNENNTMNADPGTPHVVEKAVALRNFVREKSIIAVSTLLRRLSRKVDEGDVDNSDNKGNDVSDLSRDGESKEVGAENKTDNREEPITESPLQPIVMKGRIILYTRLGCRESREVRKFLYMKRLRYVEINIDVYPNRKIELEKVSGSTSVPKVFFNEVLIGDLSKLKALNESGKLDEKIDFVIGESPSFEAPVPPLSGEDDVSTSGPIDEMALIVRKMKESIVMKDRFSKLRRFTNCFLGCEAVDFLSENQYLERKEAVEFGRKLAIKLFFQHVLDENIFEDGNFLYRFLDDDPIVASQCQNIPRGITTVKPKPIKEIASRLRLLSYAMFEAYASEDGRHVDYRSMHGSEEFARYLRIVEELQRVEIMHLSREETIAFFINLYNMMTIHAILVWGHPTGALERRKMFGDFKYIIGGSTYSLSAIQNGVLRGNQRQPYTLMRPFGAKDKRLHVALSFPEPLIHFALVCGTRSGPALRCYSPRDIDSELMDATRNFLRNGGISIDFNAKVAYASKILKWFSVDFGKNEVEVMKHVSIYLDSSQSEILFDLLATSELKVIYQPYDWDLNC